MLIHISLAIIWFSNCISFQFFFFFLYAPSLMTESMHLLFSSSSFCPLSEKAISLVHSWKLNCPSCFPLQPDDKLEPDGCQMTVTDLRGGSVQLTCFPPEHLQWHLVEGSKFQVSTWKTASRVGDKSLPKALLSLVKSTLNAHSCCSSSSGLWAVGSNGPMKWNPVTTRATELPWDICTAPNAPSHLTYKMKGLEIHPSPSHC